MKKIHIAILFCLALGTGVAVRIAVYRECVDNEPLIEVMARTQRAEADAAEILSGKGFGTVFHARSQGYVADDTGFALYVAFLWKMAGIQSINVIRIGTLILDLIAMVVLAAAIGRLYGARAGTWTAWLYALYLPAAIESIFATNYVLVLHGAILLLGLLIFFPRGLHAQIILTVALAGSLLVLDLIRAVFIPLAPLLAIALVMKWGLHRGVVLGALLACITFSGVLVLRLVFESPAHPIWHNFFLGLGEGPDPHGMVPHDQYGVEQAEDTSRGANLYKATNQYLAVIKGRSLTIIDESPRFYIQLLGRRVLRVLYGMQEWTFFSIGLSRSQTTLMTGILVGLALLGVMVCLRERVPDTVFLFLMYLYFSFMVVPVATSHPRYFIAGAGMQIPLAAIFLGRLSLRGLRQGEGERVDLSFPMVPWRFNPFDRKVFLSLCGMVVVVPMLGTGCFLWYAHRESTTWRMAFLENLARRFPTVAHWEGEARSSETPSGRDNVIAEAGNLEVGVPHFFHSTLEVARGRIALEVRSSKGAVVGKRTFNSGPGLTHCFVGWVPSGSEEYTLHVWDALPSDWPSYYDEEGAADIHEAFVHYGCIDHAKAEFCPRNEVSAGNSLFPNGHLSIPFRIDKVRWGRNEQKIPAYWAGRFPVTVRVKLPHAPKIGQIVVRESKGHEGNPRVSIQKAGGEGYGHIEPVDREDDPLNASTRYWLEPTSVTGLEIAFEDPEKEGGIAFLKDVSLPDQAEFRVIKTSLHRCDEGADVGGYPTRLSFLEP